MSSSSGLRVLSLVAFGMALLSTPRILMSSEIPTGAYPVSGKAVNKIGGHPMAGVRVTLQDARHRESVTSVVTTDDGHFAFRVPAGKYGLSAEKRGFLPTSYKGHEQFSTAIVTGADYDTANLALQLAPNPVLRGKVIDESGEPVRDATVIVLREGRQSGIAQIRAVQRVRTDDQGNYEATPLEEGTYFVEVQAKPWYAIHGMRMSQGDRNQAAPLDPSLDVAYPITYYGDTADADEATPIPIRGGAKVEADVHLSPVPSLHVTIRVKANESSGYAMPMLQAQSLEGAQFVETGGVQSQSQGVFEIAGIPAGHYTLAERGGPQGQMTEPTEVELSPTNSEIDMSSATLRGTVKAKIRMADGAQLPVTLRVALRNSKGRIVSARPVSPEGEVTFPNVSSGQYAFRAATEDRVYAVNIVTDKARPAGYTVDVSSGASMEVTLSLMGGDAGVEGVAQKSGKPFAGAMIVLVPNDPERREFFRRDQSDMDGTFSLVDVFPGTYTVIAIEDGWELDWAKPEVLARYTRHGQSVTIASQGRGSAQLSEPVEVQPK